MKTKEQMDELLKGVVVHCTTEEEANQVLDLANKLGYKWRSFAQSCRYQRLGESTCYNIIGGSYQTAEYYRVNNYAIITAQEFIDMVVNEEENKMETQEVKTEVDVTSLIPEGYEIDRENSTLECIKFKKKILTYDDVAKELFDEKAAHNLRCGIAEFKKMIGCHDYSEYLECSSKEQVMKLAAINKILNVAKYLNKGWKPNFKDANEEKYFPFINDDGELKFGLSVRYNDSFVNFRDRKITQQATEILGEETFQLALSIDY